MNPPWSQNTSTSQQGLQSPVFLDENGHALHIFVQVELEGRPRLIRNIRAAGAQISADPEQARIFLVDPETAEGQNVIAGWGSTGSHAVLHLDWVRSCLDRGSALLARDDWGGHRLYGEEGIPVNDEVAAATQNPLPTPRQTPVEGTPPNGSVHPPPIQGVPIPQSTPFQCPTNGNMHVPMSQPPTPMVPQFMPNSIFPQAQQQVNMNIPANLAQTVFDMITRNMMVPQVPQQFPLGFQPNPNYFAPPPPTQQTPEPTRSRSASYHTAEYVDSRDVTPSQSLPVNGTQNMEDANRARKRPRYSEPTPSNLSRSASVASERAGPSGKKKSRRARLFTGANGKPLGFVVQVDLRNRMEVVQSIKTHGGAIKADIQDADYAILSHQSTTFMDLFSNAAALDKPAVQAAFVHDCVEQGRLLDPDQYSFESAKLKTKRGRPPAGAASPLKTPKKEKMEVKPKHTPSPSKKEQVDTSKTKQPDSPRKTNRTPSPPPPTQAVVYAGNKNRFTEQELSYALSYAAIQYKREPDISWSSLVGKIARKMPQHSKASWVQTLSKNREPYDDLQKKAAIQHRKILAQKQAEELLVQQQAQRQQVLSHKHADPSGSSHSTTPAEALPEPPGSPPPPPPSTIPPDLASNEFKAITNSLANGIADGRSDDDVWLAMSQEHPYRTARGWRDYWDMYSEWIQPEVERRMHSDP